MGSTDRDGRHEQRISHRNTLQRMLDLEQRNKVNRMQASSSAIHPPARTSTAQARESSQQRHLELRPAMLKATGRAMTTPDLSLAIPPARVSFNATTTKYVIRPDGGIVPQEEEETEEDSDVSSICHSPGWEDSASKKRQREKREARERRKKEKSKAEADATKQDQKAKSRLSKAPPTNKRLTKMAVSMDRSISDLAIPVVQTSPEVQEIKKEESKKEAVGRARKGSLDVGLKSFMQVKNAIPVPWKSSHGTPVQTTPTQDIAPPRTSLSKTTGGFIGGLKLRQADEATVQETIRRAKNPSDDGARGLFDSDRDLAPKGPGNLSSNTSITEPYRPTSIYEESIRSPEQWDLVYAKAALLARNSSTPPQDDDTIPIMERNIRKGRRTHPPTSRYFPLANDPDSSSSLRDTSAASTSRTSVRSSLYSGDSQGCRESNVPSGQSDNIRGASAERSETTESNRGRTSNSYVRHQRRLSEDQAVAGFQDQHKVSEATTKAREGSEPSRRSRSRVRSSVDDIPSNATPATGDIAGNATRTEPIHTFLNETYKLPPLQLASPTEGSLTHRRKRSNSAVRGLKELKNAARSAFSKHSATPDSPTESFLSANDLQNPASNGSHSKRAATTGVVNEQSRKAENIPSENISTSPIVQDFAPQNPPAQASNSGVQHRQANTRARGPEKGPMPDKGSNGRASQSRSATGSREDYSLYDASSNIPTPTASKPEPPPKDDPPSNREFKSRDGKAEGDKPVQNGFAMMSGAVFDDAASGRESWCRTAVSMEFTEDEDSIKTPTAKRSAVDFTASQPDLPKPSRADPSTNFLDLRRESSLSHSISTPEMQDLSFLPTLKHQPLARPPKGKGKGTASKRGKHASVSKEQEGRNSPKDLVRPPPIPLSGTAPKSEGSSPTSPHSSQYLQNARLNMPRGPRSPVKSGFPPAHLPHPQVGGPEPLAKMFVVCCSCKYFHDMPSKIYECMAKPDNVVRDTNLGVSGVISTSVKCPWCGHGMSTSCCAGYATVVYLREQLH